MANVTVLNQRNYKELLDAFEHYFPSNTVYSADKKFTSLYADYTWNNRNDFIDFIYRLTNVKIRSAKDVENIKKAQFELDKITAKPEEVKTVETPQQPSATTPQNLDDLERTRADEIEKLAKTREEAKRNVESFKERRERLYQESLKTKQAQRQVEVLEENSKTLENQLFSKNVKVTSPQESLEKQLFGQDVKVVDKRAEEIKQVFNQKIQQQNQIQEALEEKKLYAKVTLPKAEPIDENVQKFIDQAKSNPQSFRNEISETIKTQLSNTTFASNVSPDQISLIADKVATDTIQAINFPDKQLETNVQNAILNTIPKSNDLINAISTDPKISEFLSSAPQEMSFFNNSTELSRNILSSINPNLARATFGPSVDEINVSLSTQLDSGFTHKIDLGQLSNDYSNLLNNQSNLFSNVSSFAKDQAQSLLLGRARTFLDAQIAKLPAESFISNIYNSKIGQEVLNLVGLSKYAPLQNSFIGSFIQQIPGASAFLEGLGNTLGIDFGLSSVAPTVEAIEAIGTVTEAGLAIEGAEVVSTEVVSNVVPTLATNAAKFNLNIALGNLVAKGASQVAAKLGMTALSAKLGAMVGSGIIPVIGTIVGFIVGAIFGKILEKIPWKKILPLLGAVGVTLIAGPMVGLVVGLGTVGLIDFAVGSNVLASTIRNAGIFIGGVIASIFITISKPFLIFLLTFPVLIVVILFIINSGAYVVPSSSSTALSSNPYIQVEKVAEPAGPFKNTDLPVEISYKITVTAKKSQLTNIVFKNDCEIFTKNPVKKCPASIPTEIPTVILPSTPYVFTYTEKYSGDDYKDSVVLDTFTVIADAVEAKQQTVSGAASITIGNPPAACLVINPNDWPTEYYSNIIYARSVLGSQFGSYVSKVCLSYTSLPLRYNAASFGSYWGWNHGTYIDFFQLGVKNKDDALYTLAHELGHSFAWGDKTAQFYQIYLETPGITSESPYCFYSATQSWNSDESMPESIALRILNIVESRCGSVQSKWPIHYQFLTKYVFN